MFETEWVEELRDRNLQRFQIQEFGVAYLDDALRGIFPNDLIVLGARTGRGKTEFATTIALNAAKKARNVAFFALEADRWEIHRRLKYRAITQLITKKYFPTQPPRYVDWLADMDKSETESLDAEVEKELAMDAAFLRIIYKGSNYRIDDFLEDMKAIKDDTQLIVIDHLHYFDVGDENETQGLKRIIHAIRNVSIHDGIPIVLISHLRKSMNTFPTLDDFHGHSDIVKVATNVILMAPADVDAAVGTFPTYVHIAKSRKCAEVTPFVGLMGFDRKTNSYNGEYFLYKSQYEKEPKPFDGMTPSWAKNAKKLPDSCYSTND